MRTESGRESLPGFTLMFGLVLILWLEALVHGVTQKCRRRQTEEKTDGNYGDSDEDYLGGEEQQLVFCKGSRLSRPWGATLPSAATQSSLASLLAFTVAISFHSVLEGLAMASQRTIASLWDAIHQAINAAQDISLSFV